MGQYTVKSGDNLTAIARLLSGVTGPAVKSYVSALTAINSIKDPNKIYPGQKLNFPNEWLPPPKRDPLTIEITKGQTEPIITPIVRPPIGTGFIVPGVPLWKNPLVIGAAAIIAIMFIARR